MEHPSPQPTTDRSSALAFIAAQQKDPSTATAYVGTLEENLESDLNDLDQPWMQTLRVIHRAESITGAALIEWDVDADMAWVYGPWTTPSTWAADAPTLLKSVMEQAAVERFQMYADVANTRTAQLAQELGGEAGAVNVVFEAERSAQSQPDDEVRVVAPGDESALTRLHHRAFPSSYATAAQLIAPDSEYTTLVLSDQNGFIGYVAGQPDGDDAYLDFVAVTPARRREGAASRLVRALAHELSGKRISLTCDTTQAAAIALYESLQWERMSQTRAYTLLCTAPHTLSLHAHSGTLPH